MHRKCTVLVAEPRLTVGEKLEQTVGWLSEHPKIVPTQMALGVRHGIGRGGW